VDVWPHLKEHISAGPIALDVYGALTVRGHAFRHPTETNLDFYTLFDNWVMGGSLSVKEQHFVIGLLIRGGVFGGK
jgi:CRISPR-associated protein Csy3